VASQYKLQKIFNAFEGLDLRSSDLLRSSNAATAMQNVSLRTTGAMSKRKGYQIATRTEGGLGTTTFANVNTTTGVVTEETLTVDDDLHKLTTETLTITYTGANTARYDMYVDDSGTSNVFRFDIYDIDTRLLNLDLGTGQEASFVTITTLNTAINALTDFSSVISGNGSEPAAFLTKNRDIDVPSTGVAIDFNVWTTVSTPTNYTTPFSAHEAARDDDDFENATFASVNEVMYISNGYDDLFKYDGTRVYRAGLPTGSLDSVSVGIAGVLNSTYYYRVTYEYTDAKENYIEGIISDAISVVLASEKADIVVDNIQDSTGFDTDSTDLNINIYRTKAGSTETGTYFLVTQLTNDGTSATQSYTDNIADNSLGAEFITPIVQPGLPPKGRYIDVWRSQLIITGTRTQASTVHFSDIQATEGYSVDNSFLIDTRAGGKIMGQKPLDNALYIFKEKSISVITGDLGTSSFTIDTFSEEGIGCVANQTIKEIDGKVWFLSEHGVYSVTPQGTVEESATIKPKFAPGNAFDFSKAVAFNWVDEQKYVLLMPVISTNSSSVNYFNMGSSEILVYDKFRKGWFEWDNLNIGGNMAETGDTIFFTGRELDIATDAVKNYTYRMLDNNDTYDYADHENSISFSYTSNWESLGEPSVYKKFLRVKVHSLDASLNNFETDDFILTVKSEHNYVSSTVANFSLDFSGGAEGWGNSAWGDFPWGESRLSGLKNKLPSRKSRSMRLLFENSNLHENVLISGFELEVAAPYALQIKE